MLRIGIDIGGTFTDFVVHDTESGQLKTFKLLSDPTNPAKTVIEGLNQVNPSQPAQIVHGSTVATNALLERKGAKTALVTTYGFKDVLQIGRQNRPELYDWTIKPAEALVDARLRTEVHERVDHNGEVLVAIDPAEITEICDYLGRQGVESVAICLLFSFLYPQHEKMIAEALRGRGYFVSASSEILPEFREYERTSTTVINAYVSPILSRYLSTIEGTLPGTNMHVMQSNGGMISLEQAKANGARCILSGPAGGIIGANHIGKTVSSQLTGQEHQRPVKLITFDMGGTSTDVSLINGQPGYTTESVIGGFPIHLPLLDIHTIGAGGGSIAYVDAGGSLRVGPQSAGAFPGPACYGRGDLPTVTDANLVLGRLVPEYFLGGEMAIYPERAYAAMEKLGSALNLSPVLAAKGVVEVVNAQMERALRVISIERGYDPQDFSLLSFGGAGGLHASKLARQMNIPRIIVPKLASTLSAFGMLASDVVKDYVRTVMLSGIVTASTLDALFLPLTNQGVTDLQKEGISREDIIIQRSIDARYAGQSYELNVPLTEHYLSDFQELHELTYGYCYQEKEIEIVNIRVMAIGKVQAAGITPVNIDGQNIVQPDHFCRVELEDGSQKVACYKYDAIQPGNRIAGPALIISPDTTILVDNKDEVLADRYLNLIIDVTRK